MDDIEVVKEQARREFTVTTAIRLQRLLGEAVNEFSKNEWYRDAKVTYFIKDSKNEEKQIEFTVIADTDYGTINLSGIFELKGKYFYGTVLQINENESNT